MTWKVATFFLLTKPKFWQKFWDKIRATVLKKLKEFSDKQWSRSALDRVLQKKESSSLTFPPQSRSKEERGNGKEENGKGKRTGGRKERGLVQDVKSYVATAYWKLLLFDASFYLLIFQKPCCGFCWHLHYLRQSDGNWSGCKCEMLSRSLYITSYIRLISFDKTRYDNLCLGVTFSRHSADKWQMPTHLAVQQYCWRFGRLAWCPYLPMESWKTVTIGKIRKTLRRATV